MTSYWNITDREELKAWIVEQKECVVNDKKVLDAVKASTDEVLIKQRQDEMQELSRQISKLEAPERKFIDEAKRMFLDFGRQNSVGVEYNRVSNGYTYSTIQDDVIDAIKRHVKISKVPRADVEDFVKSLILRYQEEKFGKIIKEKKLQAHVLHVKIAEINDSIKKDADRLDRAERDYNSSVYDLEKAEERLADEVVWVKVAERVKKEEQSDSEKDKLFSEEIMNAIYKECTIDNRTPEEQAEALGDVE